MFVQYIIKGFKIRENVKNIIQLILKEMSKINEESQKESQRLTEKFREDKQKQQQEYDDLIRDLQQEHDQSIVKTKEEQEIIRLDFEKERLIKIKTFFIAPFLTLAY